MTSTSKIRLDGLMQLAKIHRDQFDERRRTEWKLVFVVLAFYFSLITTKLSGKIDLNGNQSLIIGFVIFGIAIITWIYLGFIHYANYKNKRAAEKAEDKQYLRMQKNEKERPFNRRKIAKRTK